MLNLNYLSVAQAWRRLQAMEDAQFFELHGWATSRGQALCPRNGSLTLSLALGAVGVQVAGPLQVEAGPLAGRRADAGANRFAAWLAGRHGRPDVFALEQGIYPVIQALAGRRGMVVFRDATGPGGGTAALLDGHNTARTCVAAMRRPVREVWFWPLC